MWSWGRGKEWVLQRMGSGRYRDVIRMGLGQDWERDGTGTRQKV